jgi:hypothetical protein
VRNAVLCLGISVPPPQILQVAAPPLWLYPANRSVCLSTSPTKSLVDELRLRGRVGPAGSPHGTMCTSVRRKALASGETSQWMADISPNSGAVATVSKFRRSKSRTIPFQPSSLIFPLTQRYSSAVLAPAERHAS